MGDPERLKLPLMRHLAVAADAVRIAWMERVLILMEGRIVHDGGIGDRYARRAPRKEIRIAFGGPWDRGALEAIAGPARVDGDEAVVEVEVEVDVVEEIYTERPDGDKVTG